MANYIQNYNGGVQFKTGSSQGLTVDINGSVGIGTTPSTWYSTAKAIQLSNYGSVIGSTNGYVSFANNLVIDSAGNNRYLNTSSNVNLYQVSPSGVNTWYTAGAGIAGATTTITSGQVYTVTVLGASTLAKWQAFFSALSVLPTVGQSITATATGTLVGGGTVTQVITFNQVMTLDASGRLGVGTSNTSAFRLSTYGKGTTGNVWGDNLVQFVDSAPNETGLRIAVNASTSGLTQLVASTNSAASQFGFWTYNGTSWGERARIDSNGNVGIGTAITTPNNKLAVAGSIDVGGSGNSGISFHSSSSDLSVSTQQRYIAYNSGTNSIEFYKYTNGTFNNSQLSLDVSGNLGIGTPLNTWESRSRVIQTGFNNKAGYVIENFTSGNSADSNPVNTGVGFYRNTSNVFSYINSFTKPLLFSMFNGSYSWLTAPAGASDTPITWTNALTLDASGNLLLTSGTGALGYGTGAGGAVTQLTSKSTAVTLNKPSGQIITHNAALAAGASIQFQLINSLITPLDQVVITNGGGGALLSYSFDTWVGQTGSAYIAIRNVGTLSASDTLTLNFTVIKGANT